RCVRPSGTDSSLEVRRATLYVDASHCGTTRERAMSTVEPHIAAAGTGSAAARVLHLANPYMTGPDVTEAQQLLTSGPYGDFHTGGIDGEYGELTAGAAMRAKWALGYPAARVDGAFGPRLKEYLEGTPLPGDYAARRARRLANPTAQLRAQV